MKALSCKEPWAELIASGRKGIEVRSRPTLHRGELAIHASLRYDDSPAARAALQEAGYLSAKALPAGRFVAIVNVADCRPFQLSDAASACTPWRPDHYAWILCNPRRVESAIPVAGRLGLWDVPAGILSEVPA